MTARREAARVRRAGSGDRASVTLSAAGRTARIGVIGAALETFYTPGRDGRLDDIVLGPPRAAGPGRGGSRFGAVIGRFANRIAGAAFTLDGHAFHLSANDGANCLHGGADGFDSARWRIVSASGGETAQVSLEHVSPDGDQGFPGRLRVRATYTLEPDGPLSLILEAETDRPTVVGLSHHPYFALGGSRSSRSALESRLTILADAFLAIGSDRLPAGAAREVAGTAFDFRRPAAVGPRIARGLDVQTDLAGGLDHAFLIRGEGLRPAARLEDPVSGRTLELLTDQPALHVYSGGHFDGRTPGKRGRPYGPGAGIALEAESLPDAPNRPGYGRVRLDAGERYARTIIYRPGRL